MKFRWFGLPHRKSQETERQEEIQYRVRMADVKRQAEKMRRDAAAARSEAYRLEQNGEHTAAVSKAMEAANNEKAYKAAMETLRRCETMHAQAKTQNGLMKLLTECENVSRTVIGQIDTEGVAKAQEKLQQTSVIMEQVQDSMQAFQDGFDPLMAEDGYNLTGEQELAAILKEKEDEKAEVQRQEAAEAEALTESAKTETVKAETAETAKELRMQVNAEGMKEQPAQERTVKETEEILTDKVRWLQEKRRELAEIG